MMGERDTTRFDSAGERYFRWRGGAVSRLEGLSDAVFAISMTLLVVSLEVPHSFDELRDAFSRLPAFAICFALLLLCWFYHHQFHRRYGLEDGPTIFLNSLLLFLVLFYVYPLKFLFGVLTAAIGGGGGGAGGLATPAIRGDDMATLMLLYSGGFGGIFVVFAAMTWHAWRCRRRLELTATEEIVTRATLSAHLLSTSIALASILLALAGGRIAVTLSGLVYFLMGPAHGFHGWRWGRRIQAAAEAEAAQRA